MQRARSLSVLVVAVGMMVRDDSMRIPTELNEETRAQQMRKSGKQLESERASGRPESRSKGVDR